MKTPFKRVRSLLLVAPIAASAIAVFPAQAATLSDSQTFVLLDQFTSLPDSVATDTNTSTSADVGDHPPINSEVNATADADADFTVSPSQAINFTSSRAEGSGVNYSGFATSAAEVEGLFKVKKNQPFTFNFLALLGLTTAVDNPQTERAIASSSVLFQLFDHQTQSLLDSFEIFAQLDSAAPISPVRFTPSSNNWIFTSLAELDVNGNQTSLLSSTLGQYSRTFDTEFDLSLRETKLSTAQVTEVPEPSLVAGMIGLLSLAVARRRGKLKKNEALSVSSATDLH